MPSTLDTAKDKLAEAQFKNLFDNPRTGSHNSKEVIQWTFHNPNGSDETLWVPLKTKDNQPLPTQKVKNNIHNKCYDAKKQLAAHHPATSQISIHGRSQPTYQRGASSELTTSTRSSGAKEEVTEHYAPDGTFTRHVTREVESHEETTTLKTKVTELEQQVTGLKRLLADGHEGDMCQLAEICQKESDEKEAWYKHELARLQVRLEAKEKECKSWQAKQRPVIRTIQPVDRSTPLPEKSLELPLEFDPSCTPSHTWTSEKLLSYLIKCPRSNVEGFTKMIGITDDDVGMHKTSICCRFLPFNGNVVDLWMPQPIVYLTLHYHQIWKAFQKEKEAIDTSWDDWGKFEEANQQEGAKEQARYERKRKQEAEDRAAKRQTGMGSVPRSSTTPQSRPSYVRVKLSTRDTSSSKPIVVQLELPGKAKSEFRVVRR